MKTVNPKPLDKIRTTGESLIRSLKLMLGGAAFSVFMVLFFFGGTLYAILAGFAAAAGLVHWFDGPPALAYLLGVIFAFLALQPGAHLLLFVAAFLGAAYAWDWNGLVAFIVFLPGLFFIPLAFLAATALGVKGYFHLRGRR